MAPGPALAGYDTLVLEPGWCICTTRLGKGQRFCVFWRGYWCICTNGLKVPVNGGMIHPSSRPSRMRRTMPGSASSASRIRRASWMSFGGIRPRPLRQLFRAGKAEATTGPDWLS